jgi:hypothetical protein
MAGCDYVINDNNKEIITKLIIYFNGSPLAEDLGISLKKGIFLCGNFGAGKTEIFRITHKYLENIANPNPNIYRNTSVEEILTTLRRGTDDSNLFTFNQIENTFGIKKSNPLNICINEFAVNYDMKIYGTEASILMESFYMKRYEIFQNNRKLTHATCNYDIETIQKSFPERIVDRFKEMFNILELKGGSFRK